MLPDFLKRKIQEITGKDPGPASLPSSQPEEKFWDEPLPPDSDGEPVEVVLSDERLEMAGIMRDLLQDPGYMRLYVEEENDLRRRVFRLDAVRAPEIALRVELATWQFMAKRIITMRQFVQRTDDAIEDNLRIKQAKETKGESAPPE